MRKLTNYDKVTYTVECLPEDMPVEGNAMSSGDDQYDKEVEESISNDLDSGNPWAWCVVKVTAEWNGLKGVDYLGGCSYKSEYDFRQDGYYEDMKDQALQDLNNILDKEMQKLSQINDLLKEVI